MKNPLSFRGLRVSALAIAMLVCLGITASAFTYLKPSTAKPVRKAAITNYWFQFIDSRGELTTITGYAKFNAKVITGVGCGEQGSADGSFDEPVNNRSAINVTYTITGSPYTLTYSGEADVFTADPCAP